MSMMENWPNLAAFHRGYAIRRNAHPKDRRHTYGIYNTRGEHTGDAGTLADARQLIDRREDEGDLFL